MSNLIDGRAIASVIREEVKAETSRLRKKHCSQVGCDFGRR